MTYLRPYARWCNIKTFQWLNFSFEFDKIIKSYRVWSVFQKVLDSWWKFIKICFNCCWFTLIHYHGGDNLLIVYWLIRQLYVCTSQTWENMVYLLVAIAIWSSPVNLNFIVCLYCYPTVSGWEGFCTRKHVHSSTFCPKPRKRLSFDSHR